jgi:hypothetical protein
MENTNSNNRMIISTATIALNDCPRWEKVISCKGTDWRTAWKKAGQDPDRWHLVSMVVKVYEGDGRTWQLSI